MASTLPTPVAAAIGVVPAVFEGVRRLPGKAISLPILAVSHTLATMDTLRREYVDLADRGEALLARLRGGAREEVADLEQDVQQAGAAVARLTDRVTDAAREAVPAAVPAPAKVATAPAARATPATPIRPTAPTTPAATPEPAPAPPAPSAAAPTADAPAPNDDEAPKGVPTPKAVEPDSTRVETAAAPEVVRAADRAAAAVPQTDLQHDELPLPDYDHMTLGSLRGRMRALSVDQLAQIRAYEKAHANRLPVVTMLDNRLAKLATDAAATPAGPVSTRPAPGQTPAGTTPAAKRPAAPRAPKAGSSQGLPTSPAHTK